LGTLPEGSGNKDFFAIQKGKNLEKQRCSTAGGGGGGFIKTQLVTWLPMISTPESY
jgi:hypothetical protein